MISFNTTKFYLFVLFFALIFRFFHEKVKRQYLLFIANFSYLGLLLFYRKKHLIVLFLFVFLGYLGLKWLEKSKHKQKISALLIIKCLLFLCFFKYSLIQETILQILPVFKTLLKPAVFLGISFFSFRYISVIVDTASKEPDDHPINFFIYFNFLLFFPSFMMGPLDRYQRFAEDTVTPQLPKSLNEHYLVIERIIWGAFKKIVIADTILEFSSASMNENDLNRIGMGKFLLSHYFFYIALYLDFSGYCDIAISTGRYFGIRTPENFNHPYRARNIQDFWQSWHMSFMEWLKDYLFYPFLRFFLNLNDRLIITWTSLSFFLTFLLAGIWHGDGKNFFYYGMFHGVGFMVWFTYKNLLKKKLSKPAMKAYNRHKGIKFMAQFTTFHFFIFSLMWFLNIHTVFFSYLFGSQL